jgi:hypothetical protein
MTTVLAWVWVPLVVLATALGVGLLAERFARHRLPGGLLAPVGFAGAIVLVSACYQAGLTRAVTLPLLLVVAVAGLVTGRAGLAGRLRPGPAGAAALGSFLLYLAPVALSGHWTWAGYNFTNDQSLTFLAVDWVVHHGAGSFESTRSTYDIVASQMMDNGYPLGSHLLLGTLTPLTGIPFAATFQAFLALVIALGAAAMVSLGRAARMPAWAAVVAAIAATGGGLLYAYGQLGGLKEMATVTLLVTAAAVAQEGVIDRLRLGAVALAAVVLAALVPVLSAAGLAYAGLVAVAILAALLISRERPPLRRLGLAAALAIVVFLVAVAAPLADALRFGDVATSTFSTDSGTSTGVLGQLLRPLPLGQAAGVWFAEDWRRPVAEGLRANVNAVLIGAIAVFALLGLLVALRRRSALALVALAVAGVALVVAPRVSPYGDSKLLIILTPFVLLTAATGLSWLGRRGTAAAVGACLIGAILAGGVAFSDAIVYREARLAPTDRLQAIEDVAQAAKGRGLTLFNEWEEYAKYFGRAAQINVPGETEGPRPIVLRHVVPTFGQHFDLDEQALSYVESFPAIITRRGPATSRPPANYRRVYRNRFYELWVRGGGVRVADHLPAEGPSAAQKLLPCPAIRRFARAARRGETLLAHRLTPPAVLDTARVAARSPGFFPITSIPDTVVPLSPGQASATVSMRAGRYVAWVRGTSGRPIQALVDGRVVGALRGEDSPRQWTAVGEVTVVGGRHQLELRRGSGSLRPGDGHQGGIGPLALVPVAGADEYVPVAPGRAARLCGRPVDWIERVSGTVPRTP